MVHPCISFVFKNYNENVELRAASDVPRVRYISCFDNKTTTMHIALQFQLS